MGVASRDELGEMERFVSNTSTEEFPHIADFDADIWESFGVGSQPAFVFVNDDGEWAAHVGSLGFDGIAARVDWLVEN